MSVGTDAHDPSGPAGHLPALRAGRTIFAYSAATARSFAVSASSTVPSPLTATP